MKRFAPQNKALAQAPEAKAPPVLEPPPPRAPLRPCSVCGWDGTVVIVRGPCGDWPVPGGCMACNPESRLRLGS